MVASIGGKYCGAVQTSFAQIGGPADQLDSARDPGFGKNIGEMKTDGSSRHTQGGSHFLIAFAPNDQLIDLQLALGKTTQDGIHAGELSPSPE